MIVALASIITVSLASQQVLDIRRTSNQVMFEHAYQNALGAEIWISQLLARDAQKNKYDDYRDEWAAASGGIKLEEGSLLIRVEDLQGRFNINNLVVDGKVDKIMQSRFQRLLTGLQLDPALAVVIVDWLDSDAVATFPGGAEDDDYLGQDIPYRTANRSMSSPSELLLLKGITREIYRQLLPYVTTLPARTDLNINTASSEVLTAWLDTIDPADASQVAAARTDNGYQAIEQFLDQELLKGKKVTDVAVTSDYFLVNINSRFAGTELNLNSLLKREADKVSTLTRSREGY
jgi:general secretion pathway protein K